MQVISRRILGDFCMTNANSCEFLLDEENLGEYITNDVAIGGDLGFKGLEKEYENVLTKIPTRRATS